MGRTRNLISLALLAAIPALAAPASAQTEAAAPFVPPVFAAAELRADLAHLIDTLTAVHPAPFGRIARVDFDAERARLEAELRDGMTARQFYLLIGPLLARLGDGHTLAQPPVQEWVEATKRGGQLFPFNVEIRGRRIFVTQVMGKQPLRVGSEITAINGVPAAQVIERLLPYSIGEREPFRLAVIQANFRFMLWFDLGFEKGFELGSVTDGAAATVKVPGEPAGVIWSPAYAQPAGEARPPASFEMLPGKVGHLRVSAFEEVDKSKAIYRSAFETMRSAGAKALIVDLRGNEGGDSQIGDALLGYLADRPVAQSSRIDVKVSAQIHAYYREPSQANRKVWHYEEILAATPGTLMTIREDPVPLQPALRFAGPVYVLVDRATYSAAVMFAAAIKDHGLGTIVGEETGGLATQLADTYQFTLPRTGIPVMASHKRIVRPSGGDDGRGVVPDFPAERGDAILQRAIALIEQR
jgi:hypothetical protein